MNKRPVYYEVDYAWTTTYRGLVVKVSLEDRDLIEKQTQTLISKRYSGFRGSNGNLYLHRLIADRMGLKPLIDHINQDKLDNRRENLRSATKQKNAANIKSFSHGSSGFKGVHYHKSSQKYHAHITVQGDKKHLGTFNTKEEAAKAYDKAALKYFGEFASLNYSP